MFRVLFLLLLAITLNADEQLHEAELHFENEAYAKAFVIYMEYSRQHENPETAYKLGWMYENGMGVEADPKAAIFWYKKAAQWEIDKSNIETIYETLYSNLDPLDSEESTHTLVQSANGKFGLRAYEPNYWVVSYSENVPRGDPALQDSLYINTETKFQISMRADYVTEWWGFTQMWTGAYTQTSYWQLFIDSSPFRESNYKPEIFVTFPFFRKLDAIGLKAVALGYKHASNGQPGNDLNATREYTDGPYRDSQSRSWNRLYIRSYFQWKNLFAELTLWHRMREEYASNDNPNITDFYGDGALKLGYISGNLLSRLTLRYSLDSKNTSGELEMSYPVPLSDNIFFYLQAFSGYGQSLIDYDRHVNQVGFGLSISR